MRVFIIQKSNVEWQLFFANFFPFLNCRGFLCLFSPLSLCGVLTSRSVLIRHVSRWGRSWRSWRRRCAATGRRHRSCAFGVLERNDNGRNVVLRALVICFLTQRLSGQFEGHPTLQLGLHKIACLKSEEKSIRILTDRKGRKFDKTHFLIAHFVP